MNIQKLEAVLEEMRRTTFVDVESAADLARNWANRIGDAVTEHLVGELVGKSTPSAASPELGVEPGGHDWDKSGI